MYDAIIFTDVTDTVTIFKAIGAYKIANTLRQHGYSCLVVDHLHAFSLDEIKSLLNKNLSEKTLFVGLSTTFFQNTLNSRQPDGSQLYSLNLSGLTPQGIDFETEIVKYIKTINYKCKIVVGGTRAHSNLNNKNIDYSIIGYGESSIINLANYLRHGMNLVNSYKNIYGITVIDNKTNDGYDFVNSRFTWTSLDVGGAKVLPLEIARGCIFKCKFCSYPLNGKQNLDFIRHTDILFTELQDNYNKFGIQDYEILDDTFNDNEYKLDILLGAIKRLNFQPKFWAYTRLDLITQKPDLLDKLYDIGLRAMFFGIETLHKRTGLIIGKGFDRSKQIAMVQKIRNKYGNSVLLHGSFILGLPEEPLDSMHETFNQLLDETIPLHSFRFHALQIHKNEKVAFNSEIGKNYTEFGYKESNPLTNTDAIQINWENNFTNYNEMISLAKEFNDTAQKSERMHVSNQIAFSMKNLGYSEEYINSIKFKDVNWTEMNIKKENFIRHYKDLIYV